VREFGQSLKCFKLGLRSADRDLFRLVRNRIIRRGPAHDPASTAKVYCPVPSKVIR
jgi:hypothetical protein